MVHQDKQNEAIQKAIQQCRDIFIEKLKKYGNSFTEMRLSSLNDMLMIKAMRIKSLENKNREIDETIIETWQAIANYSLISIMVANLVPINSYREAYDMFLENHDIVRTSKSNDYDNAWLKMEHTSFVDFGFTKIMRNKRMLGASSLSTLDAIMDNLIDIYNYAILAIARLTLDEQE